MRTYSKYPYRTEFPDSSESGRNSQTLEDALWWARWVIHRVRREANEHGNEGEPVHPDADTAIITNRNTGYRWILRRKDWRVEFQTSEMFEEAVANESIDLHLTIEEAEALARAAKSSQVKDRRQKALLERRLSIRSHSCAARCASESVPETSSSTAGARGIPQRPASRPMSDEPGLQADQEVRERSRYRPLGDPDNLSLKEAGEVLGKARNTIYLWYRNGKFPPAVDIAPYIPGASKPVIVVPRYRLEAWQAGERMPAILEEVFEAYGLHEPPWVCWTRRKDAGAEDIAFWSKRRGLTEGFKEGKRIYGRAWMKARPMKGCSQNCLTTRNGRHRRDLLQVERGNSHNPPCPTYQLKRDDPQHPALQSEDALLRRQRAGLAGRTEGDNWDGPRAVSDLEANHRRRWSFRPTGNQQTQSMRVRR